MPGSVPGYVYDNRDGDEQRRLRSLEANMDPPTFAVLSDLGVAEGWRCWEVGAGGGSVARWLAARVGPSGSVLATDIDLSALATRDLANVETRVHDVVRDPVPGAFDLVHARLLLEHLPERDLVVPKLASALRPGGWLVLEDSLDVGIRAVPPLPAADHFTQAMGAAAARAGWDTTYGERLVAQLRAAGLRDVRGRAHHGVNPPGEMWIAYRHTIQRLRARLTATGLVTDAQLDELEAALANETLTCTFVAASVVSAWGRREGS